MNCQEFESRVETLARGALADARSLAEASAHEESCGACAAMLADERALSTGLRALAAGMRGAEAPPRAEASLLAAFRARAASDSREDSGRACANVVPLAAHATARRWSWVKTAAVATSAAAAALALFVLVRPGAGVGTGQRAMIEPPPGSLYTRPPSAVAKADRVDVEEFNRPFVGGATSNASAAPVDRGARQTSAPRPRAVNASYGTGGAARAAREQPAPDARPQEIATQFIPLGQYAQAEEGHIVRVELPRSALASFGLPVNAEAAGGRVKADVLLGEDGTARAIRFIR